MNNTFDIKRFGNYLKLNMKTSAKQIAYILLALIGFYILLMISISTSSNMFGFGDTRVLIALIFIFSPCVLEKNINKENTTFNFILPTSTMERFAYLILKYVIIIPILCLIIYSIFEPIIFKMSEDYNEYKHIWHPMDVINYKNFLLIFGFQAVVFLVFLYSQKYIVAKAFIIISATFIIISTISNIANMAYGYPDLHLSVYDILDSSNYVNKWLGNVNPIVAICDTIIKIIFPFGVWLASYFRLKEIEI